MKVNGAARAAAVEAGGHARPAVAEQAQGVGRPVAARRGPDDEHPRPGVGPPRQRAVDQRRVGGRDARRQRSARDCVVCVAGDGDRGVRPLDVHRVHPRVGPHAADAPGPAPRPSPPAPAGSAGAPAGCAAAAPPARTPARRGGCRAPRRSRCRRAPACPSTSARRASRSMAASNSVGALTTRHPPELTVTATAGSPAGAAQRRVDDRDVEPRRRRRRRDLLDPDQLAEEALQCAVHQRPGSPARARPPTGRRRARPTPLPKSGRFTRSPGPGEQHLFDESADVAARRRRARCGPARPERSGMPGRAVRPGRRS